MNGAGQVAHLLMTTPTLPLLGQHNPQHTPPIPLASGLKRLSGESALAAAPFTAYKYIT